MTAVRLGGLHAEEAGQLAHGHRRNRRSAATPSLSRSSHRFAHLPPVVAGCPAPERPSLAMLREPNGHDQRSPSSCWVPFEELRVERLSRASRRAPGPRGCRYDAERQQCRSRTRLRPTTRPGSPAAKSEWPPFRNETDTREPTTATPRVWPTCRDVEAMAAATPAWARGMPETAVLVIGAFTKPKPIPKTT